MCMCQRTHLASLKGWGEKQTEQAEPDPTFPDRACAVNTRVLIFSFSSDKGTVIFSQGLHTHRMQQWVALVSESALRLPKRGAHRGSLWPYSQKGNFGKSREKPSECLFLEVYSGGPGSLQNPLCCLSCFSFSHLILLISLGFLFCLLSWRLQGAAF